MGKVEAEGNVPHDSADEGSPVKVGGVARAWGASPGVVANGDRVDFRADSAGRQHVSISHPHHFCTFTAFSAATIAATLVAAAGVTSSGLQLHVTDICATTALTNTTFNIYAGTTTNEKFRINLPDKGTFSHTFTQFISIGDGNAILASVGTAASIFIAGYTAF